MGHRKESSLDIGFGADVISHGSSLMAPNVRDKISNSWRSIVDCRYN